MRSLAVQTGVRLRFGQKILLIFYIPNRCSAHPDSFVGLCCFIYIRAYCSPLSLVAECRVSHALRASHSVRHVVEALVDEASERSLPLHTPRGTLPHASQCNAPSGLFLVPVFDFGLQIILFLNTCLYII